MFISEIVSCFCAIFLLHFTIRKQIISHCTSSSYFLFLISLRAKLAYSFFLLPIHFCRAESQAIQRELAGLSERYSQKCLELNRAEQSNAEREREISRKERDMEHLKKENHVSYQQILKGSSGSVFCIRCDSEMLPDIFKDYVIKDVLLWNVWGFCHAGVLCWWEKNEL